MRQQQLAKHPVNQESPATEQETFEFEQKPITNVNNFTDAEESESKQKAKIRNAEKRERAEEKKAEKRKLRSEENKVKEVKCGID